METMHTGMEEAEILTAATPGKTAPKPVSSRQTCPIPARDGAPADKPLCLRPILERLHRLAELVVTGTPLDRILDEVLECARFVSGGGHASVLLADSLGEPQLSAESFQDVPPLHARARPGGITHRVLVTGKPFSVSHVRSDDPTHNPVLIRAGVKSYIALPLRVGPTTIGVLFIHNFAPRDYEHDLPVLQIFADHASIAILNARHTDSLVKRAATDSLTGLPHHRSFYDSLRNEIRDNRAPFALLLCDVDDFKGVNDFQGHLAGDEYLQLIAQDLMLTCRPEDSAFRYGGDEFAVILRNARAEEAQAMAEQILRSLDHSLKGRISNHLLVPTLSIGAALYPDHAATAEDLVARADTAMYAAKKRGGDLMLLYQDKPWAEPRGRRASVKRYLRDVTIDLLYAISSAVDLKDRYTYKHSILVGRYAVKIAAAMGLPPDLTERIRILGILHDVGKLGMPDRILNKIGPLTRGEWKIIKMHSKIGADFLRSLPGMKLFAPLVLAVHENFDGTGYPDGLRGEDIPLETRIVAVADTYCSLRSERPYRKPVAEEETLRRILDDSGKRLDPAIVEALLRILPSSHGPPRKRLLDKSPGVRGAAAEAVDK